MAHNNNNSTTGRSYNPFADNIEQQDAIEVGHSPYNPFNADHSYSPSNLNTNDLIDLQQGPRSPEQAVPSCSSSCQPNTDLQDPSFAHFRTNRKSKQGKL